MKQATLILLFFLFCLSIGEAQVYRVTYVVTDDAEDFSFKYDSVERVNEMPVVFDNTESIIIEYHGTTYYFRVADIHLINTSHARRNYHYHPVYHYSGVAMCMGNPYSIRKTDTGYHTTIWIVPMKFSYVHTIHRLRAFVFTDNKKTIKRLQDDKAY